MSTVFPDEPRDLGGFDVDLYDNLDSDYVEDSEEEIVYDDIDDDYDYDIGDPLDYDTYDNVDDFLASLEDKFK